MEEHKEQILLRAKKAIDTDGIFKLSTCDFRNWNVQEHHAMMSLYRTKPAGLHISYSINFQVFDWVITNN